MRTNIQMSDYFWWVALQWRHNEPDVVSNHRRLECLLICLFRCRSKKTSKLRVTGLCEGNPPWPVDSPHKGTVTRKMFPFYDAIMWLRFCGGINSPRSHSSVFFNLTGAWQGIRVTSSMRKLSSKLIDFPSLVPSKTQCSNSLQYQEFPFRNIMSKCDVFLNILHCFF